jgi:Family of unknown function (DUF6131)
VIVLGILFIVIGWLIGLGILTNIGYLLLVVGLVLLVLGGVGRPVGGRRWYW